MQSALHIKTQVLTGNKIEINAPNLAVGDTVDIFIIPSQKEQKQTVSILDKIAEIRNNRWQFRSAEEIDQYIREERNSWD